MSQNWQDLATEWLGTGRSRRWWEDGEELGARGQKRKWVNGSILETLEFETVKHPYGVSAAP